MQTVRRTAWFYYWLSKEFIGPELDIRLSQEYETLYVISRADRHNRIHISYDGSSASVSYWQNFRDLENLKEYHARFVQDASHQEDVNDEFALIFMIETIRELMFN